MNISLSSLEEETCGSFSKRSDFCVHWRWRLPLVRYVSAIFFIFHMQLHIYLNKVPTSDVYETRYFSECLRIVYRIQFHRCVNLISARIMKSHNSMLPETRITEVWGLGLTGERPPTYASWCWYLAAPAYLCGGSEKGDGDELKQPKTHCFNILSMTTGPNFQSTVDKFPATKIGP